MNVRFVITSLLLPPSIELYLHFFIVLLLPYLDLEMQWSWLKWSAIVSAQNIEKWIQQNVTKQVHTPAVVAIVTKGDMVTHASAIQMNFYQKTSKPARRTV